MHRTSNKYRKPYKSIQINISEGEETFPQTYDQLLILSFIMCYAFSVSAFQICIIHRNTWRRWILIRNLSIHKKHQLQLWKNVGNVCIREPQYQNWNPYFTTKKLLISVTINLHKAKGRWIVCGIFSGYLCQTEHCFSILHCHLCFKVIQAVLKARLIPKKELLYQEGPYWACAREWDIQGLPEQCNMDTQKCTCVPASGFCGNTPQVYLCLTLKFLCSWTQFTRRLSALTWERLQKPFSCKQFPLWEEQCISSEMSYTAGSAVFAPASQMTKTGDYLRCLFCGEGSSPLWKSMLRSHNMLLPQYLSQTHVPQQK